jgi:hypothetical protein
MAKPKVTAKKRQKHTKEWFVPVGISPVSGEWVAVFKNKDGLSREPIACWAVGHMATERIANDGACTTGLVIDPDGGLDAAEDFVNFLRYERTDWNYEHNRPVRLLAVPDKGDEE